MAASTFGLCYDCEQKHLTVFNNLLFSYLSYSYSAYDGFIGR